MATPLNPASVAIPPGWLISMVDGPASVPGWTTPKYVQLYHLAMPIQDTLGHVIASVHLYIGQERVGTAPAVTPWTATMPVAGYYAQVTGPDSNTYHVLLVKPTSRPGNTAPPPIIKR